MTRIASSMLPASALTNLQRAQNELLESQRQTASQTAAADMKGYGRDVQTLLSSQRLVARTEGFLEVAGEVRNRLTLQDAALERASTALGDLRTIMTEALAYDNGEALQNRVADAFATLKDAFNTSLNGRYLFNGTAYDTPPVQASDVADLAANPLADAFDQDGRAQTIRIEANRTVSGGPIAKDAAAEAFGVLQRLEQFDAGPSGPFSTPTTPAQKAAMQTELQAIAEAYEGLIAAQAENGRNLKDVETSISRQGDQLNTLAQVTGDITNVDLAEVAVRLSNAQTQYQASASVFNTIRGLTLLDYLR